MSKYLSCLEESARQTLMNEGNSLKDANFIIDHSTVGDLERLSNKKIISKMREEKFDKYAEMLKQRPNERMD